MRFSFASALVVALATETVVGSSWFSKAAYNTWHENELERWLSDHDIPYPTPSDRKDLQNLVKTNWQAAVASPYANWDTKQLQKYLTTQGKEVKKGTEKNKDALVQQVKAAWSETEDQSSDAYTTIKDWIFDSWTESSLKAFCDKHGIPVPQPRTRDTLLKTARENYQTVADKAGEAAAYPGNWLYQSWSDSDLKAWLDERGIPVPQPSARDKMIATVRRNARYASLQASAAAASASASASSASKIASKSGSSGVSAATNSAASAKDAVSEKIFDAWSDSQIKAWADKNGIKVPQGSNRNELLALARKNIAKLTGDNVASSASSFYNAATSSAGNEYAKATDDASIKGNQIYYQVSSYVYSYVDWAQYQLGLKPDYLSSASSLAASASIKATGAYRQATDTAKAEL